MNVVDQNTIRDLFVNAGGNLVSGIILAIIGFAIIDQTKLRPWISKFLKPGIYNFFQKVMAFIFNKYVRIIIFLFSFLMVYFSINKNVFSMISILIVISFMIKQKFYNISVESSDFSDDFSKPSNIAKNWVIKTGNPQIDDSKGQPPPCLLMPLITPKQATHTFLIAKKMKSERGIIEADIFLSHESLINIVFFCNPENDNWHMARFDTRSGTSDGFLIKDLGKGANWRINNMTGTQSSPNTWYKIRVEFNSEKARMFKNGELLAEITNPKIFGEQIGIFNECGEVRLDNFTFTAK